MPDQQTRAQATRFFLPLRFAMTLGLVIAGILDPYAAYASLGGTANTVEADRARMQASLRMTQKDSYSIHELTSQNGVVVKEFVSPTGIVFGVTWRGPARPDLQQLLGGYFAQFSQAARTEREHSSLRRMLRVEALELVLHSGGHARSFFGQAYVPQLLPSGVQPEEIQ